MYRQANDIPEAIKHFAAATQQAPANPKGWQALAFCQMEQGDSTGAMATIAAAGRAIPSDAGFAALNQQTQLLIDAGSEEGLRPVALAVLENPTGSATALELIKMVLDNHQNNNLEGLAESLRQFSVQHPDFEPARLQLVLCYVDIGAASDAVSAAQHAMVAFPTDPQAAFVAVRACSAVGRWPEMESAAENWKARAPGEAEAADTAAAEAEIRMGQFQAALSRLQPYLDAATHDPDRHADLLTQCAIADAGSGDASSAADLLWPMTAKSTAWRQRWMQVSTAVSDRSQAVAMLDRVGAIVPRENLREQAALAETYDSMGLHFGDVELINRATAMLDALAKNDKADTVVLIAAGGQAERTGRFEAAEALYRRVLAINPNAWFAQNNLAMLIARRNGDMKEAVQLAQSAVKLQPHMANIYDTLSQMQAKSGDPKAAADTTRVAIELDPNNLTWRMRLAGYLLDAGDLAEASDAVTAIDTDIPDLQSQPADVQKQLADLRKRIHGKGT